MDTEYEEIIISLGPAILTILGFLILGYRLAVIKEGLNSKNWLRTSGKILSSELEVRETLVENRYAKSYRADISYSYCIDKKEFISKQVYCGDDIFRGFAYKSRKIIKQYPKNKETSIFYNPEKFEEAVLIRGIDPMNWTHVLLGAVIMILGLWFLDSESVVITIKELIK